MPTTKYQDSLFTVRLSGEGFETHGASIYDLSVVFQSMQRIVHKAFLASNGRLEHGQFPKKEERKMLSLAIGERKHASDAFGLIPILADPSTQALLLKLAEFVASGVVGYFTGDIMDRLMREQDPDKKIFIGSIHADVVNIVNRIDAAGGLESIQIGAPASGQPVFSDFGITQRDYVNSLTNSFYLGKRQSIKGNVYRFYPNGDIVTIRRPGGKKVDIELHEADFQAIRYQTGVNPMIIFHGCPKFKFGIPSNTITHFIADSIEEIPTE